jgi:hypothetical protein
LARLAADGTSKSLHDRSGTPEGVVDMSRYFLHETQAQLQLAMLGMEPEFMERTNADLRALFAGR